jgi:UDP:flavonoid glycosyltransferase YjiC (YdhE family)
VKFLLTTFGSLGDLHPYIAVGKGLRERGYAVALASSEIYRAKVEGEGLGFHPVRPDMSGVLDHPEAMRQALHPRTGTRHVITRMFLPYLEQSYEDTLPAARDADIIVSHPIAFATPIAAEIAKKPWISVALAPSLFLSATDPPHIPVIPGADALRRLGPRFHAALFALVRRAARRGGAPIARLRARLGLPPSPSSPIFDSFVSPWGTHAWFSKVLAQPQPDWPAKTVVTGFPFYDRLDASTSMSDALRRFLAAGPPPVVFTLGSSAVFDAGEFYSESAEAARLAGFRAVLLTGLDLRNRPSRKLPDSVFVAEYAPYSELLPHAAATVHQGGVGTTAQALRSGRPMIVVPFSHDQPDNARRVSRLGVARIVPRSKYRADRVAPELGALLSHGSYREQAARVANAMASEDGVRTACERLEVLSFIL